MSLYNLLSNQGFRCESIHAKILVNKSVRIHVDSCKYCTFIQIFNVGKCKDSPKIMFQESQWIHTGYHKLITLETMHTCMYVLTSVCQQRQISSDVCKNTWSFDECMYRFGRYSDGVYAYMFGLILNHPITSQTRLWQVARHTE